ncbi:MAG: class I SAM-dependent methyltransferase [Nocardioides sp.]
MDDDARLAEWRARYAEPTSGWDFSTVDAVVDGEPPWSYDAMARRALAGAGSALDMGTGGGEVLLTLRDALPADTVATEGWPPNLPVAADALAPHGIGVVAYDAETDARMPFEDGRFDVVMDRHEAYVATEVFRVLRPGGVFLTQQVDGRDFAESQALFGGSTAYPRITLEHLRAEARAAGFVLEEDDDWVGTMRLPDVAAFVSYVRIVPWQVPEDFSVDRYAEVLRRLTPDDLVFTQRRFVMVCRRPGP